MTGDHPLALDAPLDWRGVTAVARGAVLDLAGPAWARIEAAHAIVEAVVAQGLRAYGVNTGVGALADTVVDRSRQRALSRNLVMSHAAGVGAPLEREAVRAIMAVMVNTYARGRSGVRPAVVRALLALLAHDVVPVVPARGSVGYITHAAHIALVLIGAGHAVVNAGVRPGRAALAAAGLEPLVLEAKEGLSLVNGTPCSTGLAALALARTETLLANADAVAALTLEALGADPAAFAADVLAARGGPGLLATGAALRAMLAGSRLAGRHAGRRTQDALSLRAVPHVHGAARDAFAFAAAVVDRELAAVTDNPIVSGSPEHPVVQSQAHAVAPGLAHAADALAIAVAQLAAMAERRMDRLVNPLVSGLPPFLAAEAGVCSGLMIAQYTAAALVGENRRLAAPAGLDGGLTSGLQEDVLAHPTAAAAKLHLVLDNAEQILGIELAAAVEAHRHLGDDAARGAGTALLLARLGHTLRPYADDRPLAELLAQGRALVQAPLLLPEPGR